MNAKVGFWKIKKIDKSLAILTNKREDRLPKSGRKDWSSFLTQQNLEPLYGNMMNTLMPTN